MAVTIYPVTPSFAAEVGDIDLSRQIEPVDLAAVNKAFAEYAVLIFPDQHLSQDQHLDFAKHFGPLETTIALYRKGEPLRVRQEFADVSNLNHENNVWGKESRQRLFQLGNRLWHTDSSFKRLPARASLLYARLDSADRRAYGICRRAGGLRRAAGGNQAPPRLARGGAFDLQLARPPRLHQLQR